jgi:hypothetical protein
MKRKRGSTSVFRSAVAIALSVIASVLVFALPGGAVADNTPNDTCGTGAGYGSAFNESTVMRGAQINGFGSSATLSAYANDEKGLLLGTNGATANTSNPQHVNNPSLGDATAKDPSGRAVYPALYITDITSNPSSKAGDFQNGGTAANLNGGVPFVDDVFGTWSTATGTQGNNYHVNQPAGNNANGNTWDLGPGSDTPGSNIDTSNSQSNSTEVRWNVNELGLKTGHTYRIQVIEHDGDQNKDGGDSGEACVNLKIPGITTTASNPNTLGNPISDQAKLSGMPGGGTLRWYVFNQPAPSNCLGSGLSQALNTSSPITESTTGDGTFSTTDAGASGSFTPSAAGTYQWVASWTNGSVTVSTACNDPAEQSTVSPLSPILTTQSIQAAMVGDPVHDTATLTGATSNAGGTITFSLYNYGNGSCGTLITTSPGVKVSGSGQYSSPSYPSTDWSGTALAAGTYAWVASYSGDANNAGAPTNPNATTKCPEPSELTTVSNKPLPSIAIVKYERIGSSGSFTHGPVTGFVGDTVNYKIDVTNTGNTALVLTFTDTTCDSLSGPTLLAGSYDKSTNTLSASGGEVEYTCSHVLTASDVSGYTNTASVVGKAPDGSSAPCADGSAAPCKDSVIAYSNTPGIKVLKLQSLSAGGPFTRSELTAKVGQTIYYEIQATNTGNAPLTLSISDPMCDRGTIQGPVALNGTLTGNVLSSGGAAQYTCSHVLVANDANPFINTATVTGQPPNNAPPLSGTSSVTALRAALKPKHVIRCPAGTVKKVKHNKKGKKFVVCKAKRLSHRPHKITGFTG